MTPTDPTAGQATPTAGDGRVTTEWVRNAAAENCAGSPFKSVAVAMNALPVEFHVAALQQAGWTVGHVHDLDSDEDGLVPTHYDTLQAPAVPQDGAPCR